MSGLPGDSGYGSVRFYTKSGSRLNEIESLALEGTQVFNDAFEMGYTPRKAAGVRILNVEVRSNTNFLTF